MKRALVLSAVLLTLAAAAAAQQVGTVASVRGEAEIGRAGAASVPEVGQEVRLGDELRTGAGQLRVVFQDDSVIDLAENSKLVVDEQVFDPNAGRFSSLMRLVSGSARALVGKYYRAPGASYEVQTPTAVAGVRGTTFLVSYDPDTDATEVVGIRGEIEVRSLSERIGETVYITANQSTTVERDAAPTAPQPINERLFHHEVEGLELLSLGNLSTLTATSSVNDANKVPAPDKAPADSGLVGQLGRDQLRNIGDVVGQPVGSGGRGSLGIPF